MPDAAKREDGPAAVSDRFADPDPDFLHSRAGDTHGSWRRVVLKLSGEAFAGGETLGIDPDVVIRHREGDHGGRHEGIQVAAVVGGGNMFRGAALSARGIDRARGDYMGMLGTVINCLALQDVMEKLGMETRVQTAITMGQVAEPYIPAARHPAPGEGAGRHLRCRAGRAVLLHRHLRRAACAGDRRRGRAEGHAGGRRL